MRRIARQKKRLPPGAPHPRHPGGRDGGGGALRLLTVPAACPVACFAHVTSTMAHIEGDFEKGEAGGALDALNLISAAAGAWIQSGQS